MSDLFKVWQGNDGNLFMEPGPVLAVGATTVELWAGSYAHPVGITRGGRTAEIPAEAAFAGGSGGNLRTVETAPGDLVPQGYFVPSAPNVWVALGNPDLVLTLDAGDLSAELHDGTDAVATLPPGSGPAGTYAATPYGEATYNAAAPFNIEIEAEGGVPWPQGQALVRFTGTTVQQGLYSPTGWAAWESVDNAAWTMTLGGGGAGELHDGTAVVATRAADATRLHDPSGDWAATSYGRATYGTATSSVDGTVSAGDFPEQGYRLMDVTGAVETWVGVSDATKHFVLDTSTGDAELRDELGVVGTRTAGGTMADILGTYTANADGEERYHAAAAWDYTVALNTGNEDFLGEVGLTRAKPLEGVLFVTVTRNAVTDVATAVSEPRWAATLPDNTGVTTSFPIARVNSAGTPRQVQSGPIQWRPAPPALPMSFSGVASAGTYPAQTFDFESQAGSFRYYRSTTDADMLLVHDSYSGNASIIDESSGDTIVARASIDYTTAAGLHAATTDGEDLYNGSAAWDYTVT